MIYFFHHYELPAILQQIRIQEMLLQNQQAGQANQTALQDTLNNNTAPAAAAAATATQASADLTQPASTSTPQLQPDTQSSSPSSSPPALGGGEVRAELNWVAQTAAIITEALSTSAQQSAAVLDRVHGGGGGGQRPAGATEISVVAELWMGGPAATGGELGVDGGGGGGSQEGDAEQEAAVDANVVSMEMKPSAGGADPPVGGLMGAEPSSALPPQTDCPPTQSSGTNWDCRAQQRSSNTS